MLFCFKQLLSNFTVNFCLVNNSKFWSETIIWGGRRFNAFFLQPFGFPCYININTARTIFPKSWNIMESSKRPSKYHLSINFLAEKRPYFHHRKVQNKNFSVISKYHLSSIFGSKKDCISHLRKVQNKIFSVISKYYISINFFAQKKNVFSISENFKRRTF